MPDGGRRGGSPAQAADKILTDITDESMAGTPGGRPHGAGREKI
jgi:hypothetical protein